MPVNITAKDKWMPFPEFPEFECENDSCAARRSIRSLGNAEVEICILLESESTAPARRQLEVLESFNLLPPAELAQRIAISARRYCQQVDSVVDLASEGIEIDVEHIEKHFEILDVTIPELLGCDTDFVFLGANCDWEEEHGMQIMLMDGRVVYCGDYVTVFDGPSWKRVVSAPTKEARADLLNERLTEIRPE